MRLRRSLLLAIAILAGAAAAGWTLRDRGTVFGTRAACEAYAGLPAGWGTDPHAGMVQIGGGSFGFGSGRGYPEERPQVDTTVAAFWIDRTEVTNAQFAGFVAATGYVTEAERHPGAMVFRVPHGDEEVTPGSWWHLEAGADWRHPDGPGSGIAGRAHEPVVDVTYADALAYARWLGRELPSEAQWEFAARAGRSDAESDRDLRDAAGRPQANFWQGRFPSQDTAEDGFAGRAPVGCFPPSPNGLHDMVGNVWEWTTDLYIDRHAQGAPSLADRDAGVPQPRKVPRRVIKGGSYLCSADYCVRARASSRQGQEADLPAAHLGFRTIARVGD
ncbi:MAG: formylglycine-generating enzyme family protein [Nevskia sp.]|nr:formylglycine-generating enzyme family protein [Nevskia sp.]